MFRSAASNEWVRQCDRARPTRSSERHTLQDSDTLVEVFVALAEYEKLGQAKQLLVPLAAADIVAVDGRACLLRNHKPQSLESVRIPRTIA